MSREVDVRRDDWRASLFIVMAEWLVSFSRSPCTSKRLAWCGVSLDHAASFAKLCASATSDSSTEACSATARSLYSPAASRSSGVWWTKRSKAHAQY